MAIESLDWIAVDWGTTNLRAWAMDAGGRPLARATAEKGMAALRPEQFEPALLEAVGDWLPARGPTLALACGMVGARQGWTEAPYREVPCAPLARDSFARAQTVDERITVRIAGGLRQSDPPDVMRGEETQIAGLLAERPGYEGTACMPGTHTKWVAIRAGKVERFKSFITGELYSLLARHSVLKHSVGAGEFRVEDFDAEVERRLEGPDRPLSDAFSLRAEDLLFGAKPEILRAKLSAMLVVAEIRAASTYLEEGALTLIGDRRICGLYGSALQKLGVQAEIPDAAGYTLAGLRAARVWHKDNARN